MYGSLILCMSSWNPGHLDFFLKAHIGPVITGSDESVVGEYVKTIETLPPSCILVFIEIDVFSMCLHSKCLCF